MEQNEFFVLFQPFFRNIRFLRTGCSFVQNDRLKPAINPHNKKLDHFDFAWMNMVPLTAC